MSTSVAAGGDSALVGVTALSVFQRTHISLRRSTTELPKLIKYQYSFMTYFRNKILVYWMSIVN